MRHLPLLGVAAAAALLFASSACSGGQDDPSADDMKQDLSATFQKGEPGLPKKEADCYAALIIDTVGVENLQGVDLTADSPPKEIQDDLATAAARATEECGLSSGG